MKLITSVFRETGLLPQFLQHYSQLGVNHFIVGILEKTCSIEVIRSLCRDFPCTIVSSAIDFNGNKDTAFRHWLCKQFISPEEWWVIADLDEFHEYPEPLPALVETLDADGYLFLGSTFLDRITSDGSCPNLRPDYPLWEQFPAAADLTRLWMEAPCSKIMLIRGHGTMLGGHHRPKKPHGPIFKGGKVHHFKWFGDIEGQIRERREIRQRHQESLGKCDRFLALWETYKRFPVAGEYGFHFPVKPINWPEPRV